MTQFTVAQVLEAGRKAESEKKYDYAYQFYKHIADHHGQTPEAKIAREGLARVAALIPGSPPQGQPRLNGTHNGALNGEAGHAPPPKPPSARRPSEAPQAPLTPPPQTSARDGMVPMQGRPGQPHAHMPPSPHQAPHGPGPQPRYLAPMRPIALPGRVNDYKAGKLVSGIFSTLGWLLFGAGPVLAVASLTQFGSGLMKGGLFGVAGGLAGAVVIAVVPMVLGLTVVFWGQLARAIFDNANATRELLELQRALSEQDEFHAHE
ncbi:MAG: hypothetical protein KDJ41_15240 [Hyphomicrobiaceae bacterium]|nr:hypothetical protein [Hyphomicrobiaceae bacterium]